MKKIKYINLQVTPFYDSESIYKFNLDVLVGDVRLTPLPIHFEVADDFTSVFDHIMKHARSLILDELDKYEIS
jgi:hypothetical protein